MTDPRLLAVPDLFHLRFRASIFSLFLMIVVAACLSVCEASEKNIKPLKAPDVLVLIISGLGANDQIAISYAVAVPSAKAKGDLAQIGRESGWLMQNITVTTKRSLTPAGKPTTAAMFQTPAVVDRAQGLLPLSPIISTLKRYRSIRINYLVMGQFAFKGLKKFEDEYVKIVLSNTGNSYLYHVIVKNGNVKRINVPLRQPPIVPTSPKGMSAGARAAAIMVLAVGCSVIAYLVAVYVLRRNKNR